MKQVLKVATSFKSSFLGDQCLVYNYKKLCFDVTTDINECENVTCENGGTCSDVINGFECTCAAGFTGHFCQTGEDITNESVHMNCIITG